MDSLEEMKQTDKKADIQVGFTCISAFLTLTFFLNKLSKHLQGLDKSLITVRVHQQLESFQYHQSLMDRK